MSRIENGVCEATYGPSKSLMSSSIYRKWRLFCMQSNRAMSRCGYNGNVGRWLRGRSVSVFPLPLQAIASTTLIRRNAKLQDCAVQSWDSEKKSLHRMYSGFHSRWQPWRNLQRWLEAGSRCEGWAACRKGWEGFESRSSHPFSKGAAFGIRENRPLQASVLWMDHWCLLKDEPIARV